MSQSVAFKCTYNDGDQGTSVGFADTCSTNTTRRNVLNGRAWCSNQECECRRYFDDGLKGVAPSEPCDESVLFRDWKFGAGAYHTGERAGNLIHLTNSARGRFAILTTRFPGDEEADRKIIGLFEIERIEDLNTCVATSHGRVRLPIEEARQLFFWAYYSTSSHTPDWRTGLFRYIDDGQVHRILEDVAATVRDEETKAAIGALIKKVFNGQVAPVASGCLSEKSIGRSSAIAQLRKYGSGGEGQQHKKLKEWLASHPEALGLKGAKSHIEYRFISGDCADLVFELASGGYAVVEVETTTPLPGAHQAIKYRALLCAEKRIDLDSSRVSSILVAWELPADVKDFCARYRIGCQVHRVPSSRRSALAGG